MGKARFCSVYGCTPGKNTDLRYYRFPNNESLAKQWVYKCCRSDKINIKNAVICEIHFSKAQIRRNLKSELLNCPIPRNWRNLQEEAVPDQYLPSPQGHQQNGIHLTSALKESSRHNRAEKRKLRKMIPYILSTPGDGERIRDAEKAEQTQQKLRTRKVKHAAMPEPNPLSKSALKEEKEQDAEMVKAGFPTMEEESPCLDGSMFAEIKQEYTDEISIDIKEEPIDFKTEGLPDGLKLPVETVGEARLCNMKKESPSLDCSTATGRELLYNVGEMTSSEEWNWDSEKTMSLIQQYERFPELWNVSLVHYLNKEKKASAMKEIAKTLKIPESEITRKWHNLQCQMNSEMRKIKKKKSGMGTDDVTVKSTWEFFGALHFMIGCNTPQGSTSANMVMGPKRYLSRDKISRIYALQKAGFGAKAIVEQTGVPQRTVERWLTRCRDSAGDTPPKHLPKSGRPRKCSLKTINVLKKQIKASPSKTAREFKEQNPRILSDVSIRTVQRMLLCDLNLPSRMSLDSPPRLLTDLSSSANIVNEDIAQPSKQFQDDVTPSTSCTRRDKDKIFGKNKKAAEMEEETALKTAIDVLNKPQDDYSVFGDYVASELRQLRSDENRKKLKCIITKAIIEMGKMEDLQYSSSSSSTPIPPFSYNESHSIDGANIHHGTTSQL